MANCVTCNMALSFFGNLKSLGSSPQAKRCGQCNTKFDQLSAHVFGIIENTFNQSGITASFEQTTRQHLHVSNAPEDVVFPIVQRLQYLRNVSEIRYGNVPVIRVNIHLDSDEMAHFSMPASYHKPAKQVKIIPGTLVGTNKKLYFYSSVGNDSVTIDWNNVARVDDGDIVETLMRKAPTTGKKTVMMPYQTREKGIRLTVSKGAGGGAYVVADPFLVKTFIDTLVRLWKRQLVIYEEQRNHGTIPDHIKATVFKRDNGKCQQCGYVGEYIEYDHIHPRSKGGRNTVDNIQLLCRKCNMRKGDRV